ncbi:MAG TPA: 1-acyl-sn-glycerol-3-phosphate acyltransferase [Firmicutes bacterium]|nr:1-acyl-sn-glycerol-3-phosphate acyltransferase [Bacillota bacterium]
MDFYSFARGVCIVAMRLYFRIDIQGLENVPQDRGFILCSNHRSFADPVLLGLGLKRRLTFMAKAELFEKPVLRSIIRALGAFPVSRGAGDNSAIETAIQTVQSGHILAIFPEGTRSKDGKLLRFKSGAIVVAAQTGGDILPSCVLFGDKLRFRSKVTIKYGHILTSKELELEDLTPARRKAANERIQQEVASLLGQTSRLEKSSESASPHQEESDA